MTPSADLYADVIAALPLPGEPMTVGAFEKVRALLGDDFDRRTKAPIVNISPGRCPNCGAIR